MSNIHNLIAAAKAEIGTTNAQLAAASRVKRGNPDLVDDFRRQLTAAVIKRDLLLRLAIRPQITVEQRQLADIILHADLDDELIEAGYQEVTLQPR